METSNAQKTLGPVMAPSIEEVEERLWLYTFPDGFRCYSHSAAQETQLIYNEIFVKAEYLGLVRQISAEVHSDALWSAIQPLLTRLGFRVFSSIGIANFESAGGNNLYAIKE